MFTDLKKGFQVHTLDTTSLPKYEIGRVVAVSDPRYLPPQPGTYQSMQQRVVDLTVEIAGETKTFTVPETQSVAKSANMTLSIGLEAIMNELKAIKQDSQEVIDNAPFCEEKIQRCNEIEEEINPSFKQTREHDRKIAGIEKQVSELAGSVSGLQGSFDDLKKLIVERFK